MRSLLYLAVLTSLCMTTGCVFRAGGPLPVVVSHTAAPPPGPAPMGRAEAIDRARSHCQSQGYRCELQEAHRTQRDSVWKVKFKTARHHGKGHFHVELDAYDRRVLDVKDKFKEKKDKRHGKKGHHADRD